jgi:plastocyanin
MSRWGWPGLFAAFGAVALVVLGAVAVAAASAPVAAVNYEFTPSAITVSVGDTVVWTMSGDGHTVRSGTVGADNIGHASDGPLDSGFKRAGESYSFTFAQAGTYEYFCEIHPEQMKGTITVIAAPAGASPTAPVATAPSVAPVTQPAPGESPSAAVTHPATPDSGADQSPTSDMTPLVVGGIVTAIVLAGLILASARRQR